MGKQDMMSAKGHVAKIVRFDEKTVLLPLTEVEASRLHRALMVQRDALAQTGDFPERYEYGMLLDNLMTAMFMLT